MISTAARAATATAAAGAPLGAVTWTTVLVGLLNLLVGGIGMAIIKSRPALKKIAADREANLLKERAQEMVEMRIRIARLEEERKLDRHRINNLSQCLDALLMMIELDPSKAAEAADRIKKMRERMAANEATEKGAVAAAGLDAELKAAVAAAAHPVSPETPKP